MRDLWLQCVIIFKLMEIYFWRCDWITAREKDLYC